MVCPLSNKKIQAGCFLFSFFQPGDGLKSPGLRFVAQIAAPTAGSCVLGGALLACSVLGGVLAEADKAGMSLCFVLAEEVSQSCRSFRNASPWELGALPVSG